MNDKYTQLFYQTVRALNCVLRLLVMQDSEPSRFNRMWLAEEMRHEIKTAEWHVNELADRVRDEESAKTGEKK